MRSFWSILALSVFIAAPAHAKKYTMDDLLALEKTSAWREIIEHLSDIPPAKRSDEWKRIAEKAAVGQLSRREIDKEPGMGLAEAEALLDQYPQLASSRTFMDKRSDVGLKGFEGCLAQAWGGDCYERLTGFVNRDPKDRALAFRAGKLVSRHLNRYAAAPFFRAALVGEQSKDCADKDVSIAVVAALGLPASDPKMKDGLAIAEACWTQLSPALTEELSKSSKGSYFFDNSCGLMKAKGVLGSLQAKQCESK